MNRKLKIPLISLSTIAALAVFISNQPTAFGSEKIEALDRSMWTTTEPQKASAIREQYKEATKPKFVSLHYTLFWAQHKKYKEEQLLNNLQSGHIKDKKFGDIAYHYLVTISGKIYKGRSTNVAPASGTYYHSEKELTDATYQPNGKLHPLSVKKGKKPGHTEPHITVSFNVGLGEPKILPENAMQNAARFIAQLLVEHDLGPEAVRAHREFANSSCPGDLIYVWLRGPNMKKESEGVGMKLIREEYEKLKG
jgi:hypothetical protein